ncbi:MAG: 3-phosphoshikimate 1-carboxyvinyltransferase [Deferribacteraceae bacterium]|jgi:3-phosphoshikimate 1-carboxyvinyltransferase|nr:3-phosphoshikimate 1-carboxyvinyltransferase [Deferribacteraceae bacterium]
MRFGKISRVAGAYWPPADKSISNRALIMAAMAQGKSELYNVLLSDDCLATLGCLASLGVEFSISERRYKGRSISRVSVNSSGYKAFSAPAQPLWCGNSGNTARFMTGLLAPSRFNTFIYGSTALEYRPMEGIAVPLRKMGANIQLQQHEDSLYLPIEIKSAQMQPANIDTYYPAAQVKTGIILAALQLDGVTSLPDYGNTRDHTERLLPYFDGRVNRANGMTTVIGNRPLKPCKLFIPGDISAAAYMIAAVYMHSGSELFIADVGLNPTRCVFLDILKSWGADIQLVYSDSSHDPLGNIAAYYSRLTGGLVDGVQTSLAQEELPLLAVMGLFTQEPVEIRGATQLRAKESGRFEKIAENLRCLGATVEIYPDGLKVYPLKEHKVSKDTVLQSYGDHRLAMINILLAKRFGVVVSKEALAGIGKSYADFMADFVALEE